MSKALRCLAGFGNIRRNLWRRGPGHMILTAILGPMALHAQVTGGSRDATAPAAAVDQSNELSEITVTATASQNQVNYAIRGQTLDAFSGSSPGVLQYYNDVLVTNQTATSFYD